jgi:2-polyprenyl-3-methyl-5-hydroxy-6-metoxy-1,4-benzoquinol methylase
MNFSTQQHIQEEEYGFPYHYIGQYKGGFKTAVYAAYGLSYVSAMEFIMKKIREHNPNSICDVGTGDGRLVREMTVEFPAAVVKGIDYSERSINLARALNPTLQYIQKDIINDSVGETFDLITLIEVFEHIPLELCPDFVLGLTRLLNSNGKILLTVPHANVRLSAKHYQHFTSASLRKYFEPYFVVQEETFFENRSFPYVILRTLIKNKMFMLNNQFLLNVVYKSYKKICFFSSERNCRRIYLTLIKK